MASLAERIERLSIPEPNSGCWLWIGNVSRLGYGQIMMSNRRKEKAHRVAYRAFRAEVPDGLQVLHTCDVRCCVNPDHLWIGTRSDNMRDMYAKGRHRTDFGIFKHRKEI